jgi:hypothetical protein
MTLHHWSLTKWFPLCSATRTLFTHWDSCNTLYSIFPIGGFLTFVTRIHYWLLLRVSLLSTIYIWYMLDTYFVVVLSIFHLIPSKYLSFYYYSCGLMGEDFILSFHQIYSYRLQHIFLWDRDLESLLVPWGL